MVRGEAFRAGGDRSDESFGFHGIALLPLLPRRPEKVEPDWADIENSTAPNGVETEYMSRNIELKAQCGDLAAAERAARSLGASPAGRLWQRDTYFACRHGRLKLRQQRAIDSNYPGPIVQTENELIGYDRSDEPQARGCNYTRVPIERGDDLRDTLARTLGITVEVVKTRGVWLWKNVRIHLDEVEGLGTFTEFEAIVDERCDDVAAHGKIDELIRAFAISGDRIEKVSYSDMLQRPK
jgi:adenylate cyclase, class 2